MKKKNTIIIFLSIVLFLLVCLLFYRKAYLKINQLFNQPDSKVTIAIDAAMEALTQVKSELTKCWKRILILVLQKK